ncbi:hypothetical protein [Clostridium sp.]
MSGGNNRLGTNDKEIEENMKKRKIVTLSVVIIVIALLLEASILKYVNDRTKETMQEQIKRMPVTEASRMAVY